MIESAKCGCDITRSSAMPVEDKEMRTTKYAVVLWGMVYDRRIRKGKRVSSASDCC